MDEHLNNLVMLKNIKKINIYRCRLITQNKKEELTRIFGNKFNCD